MNALLSRVLGRKKNHQPPLDLTFTVYTREGCGCCHKALRVLSEFQPRYGFRVETIDIDGQPDLVARYSTEVPVVALNGKVRFKGQINPTLLERLLAAETRAASERGLS
jgi:glutaredoxin